ncbi:MAG: recombination protein RecR [Desulfobacterales bacterium]|nr:recombination protein RecR [Desulfobacterales bacterium]
MKNHYPLSVIRLIENFSKLPGIGGKTAERLALHVLNAPIEEAESLAKSILELKKKINYCSKCYGLSDSDLCHICSNHSRNNKIICVVEKPADMTAIEKSGFYSGLYHVLHGVISPMDGICPDKIKIKELIRRIEENSVDEVILATGTCVEGETTASYIAKIFEKYSIKLTRIASGIPIGGDLKYIDQMTIQRAMENRHAV